MTFWHITAYDSFQAGLQLTFKIPLEDFDVKLPDMSGSWITYAVDASDEVVGHLVDVR